MFCVKRGNARELTVLLFDYLEFDKTAVFFFSLRKLEVASSKQAATCLLLCSIMYEIIVDYQE